MSILKKKIALYVLVPLISCVVGGGLIKLAGRPITAEVVGVEANFYLKYYFGILNYIFPENGLEANTSIVLFDVHNYSSREEVASVLETIYGMEPKLIAMDLHFYENSSIKESVNDSLRNVIRKVQDRLIAPVLYVPNQDKTNYQASLPFYAFDEAITEVVYSEPLNHGVYDKYSSTGLSVDFVECNESVKDRIDDVTFATTVARRYTENPDWAIDGIYINYISKDFRPYNDVSEVTEDIVKGSIVLLGDLYDCKDLYSTPFKINGRKDGFAGATNLAYVLNTLITTKAYCKENTGVYSAVNCAIIPLPVWLDYMMAFVFTLLYFLCYMSLTRRQDTACSMNGKRMYILFAPILLILFELILVVMSFVLTFCFNRLPDLLMFMASVLFVGVSCDFLRTYKYFTYDEL